MKNKVLQPVVSFIMIILSVSLISAFSTISVNAYSKDDPLIVVSMGDSYSSGEGIEPFYGQKIDNNPYESDLPRSEKIKNYDWLAHRSIYSWPAQLKVPLLGGGITELKYHKQKDNICDGDIVQWYFVASSGAVTADFSGKQKKETYDFLNGYNKKYLPPQFDVFDKNKNDLYGKVDYVTMSIGGNDLGFVDIVTTSLGDSITQEGIGLLTSAFGIPYAQSPGFMKARIEETKEKWKTEVKNNLKSAYEQTREKAGPQADIIVAGYPELYYRNTSTAAAHKEQRELIDNMILDICNPDDGELKTLIDSINEDIGETKIHYVSVIDAFKDKGMDAPDGKSLINGITFWGSQRLDDGVKGAIGYASVHPNSEGAKVYAECVNAKIAEIENKKLHDIIPAISGFVYNNTDGSQEYNKDTWIGIPDVTITVKEKVPGEGLRLLEDKTVSTDANGRYLLYLLPGTYEIEASHPDYGSQSISNVIVFDNEITEAEWIVFNGHFSGTITRIPGQDPIHNYSSRSDWAWKEYDHPNYDVPEGYDRHIVKNDQSIRMYGYLVKPYKDFCYLDDNSKNKVLQFDIQRDQTSNKDRENDWHSMQGGGFLFNTAIDDDANTINGYYVLVTQNGLDLYELDNADLNRFRNSSMNGKHLKTFSFADKFASHHIKVEVNAKSVSLWDGETKVIDNYPLTTIRGNGFGPITTHKSHDCEQRSYFTFSNFSMQTM